MAEPIKGPPIAVCRIDTCCGVPTAKRHKPIRQAKTTPLKSW